MMKTVTTAKTSPKFPLKCIGHDLTVSMRGQGKRCGGMIMGAMAGRTGISFEIDVKATFSLTDEEAAEVELLNDWDFTSYRVAREGGCNSDDALMMAYNKE